LAPRPRGADVRDVVYCFRRARLGEFVVGMAPAHFWRSLRPRIRCGRGAGTALEVAVIAMTLAVMLESGAWARQAGHVGIIGPGGEAWLASSGFVCLPFAALICVMACEWGGVARFLSSRPLVLLGEISFSLYLLHLLVCHYYVIHPGPFVALPSWLLYLGYWLIVLLTAYIGWSVIEVPCRRAIVGLWDRFAARGAEWPTGIIGRQCHPVPRHGQLAAGGALLLIFTMLHFAGGIAASPPVTLAGLAPSAGRAVVAVDTIGNHPATDNAPVVVDRHDYPSDAMTVVGWSVDPQDRGPVRGVLISIDDHRSTWAEYGSARNDVSAQLGGDAFLHSGYIGKVSLKDLSDGLHTITIKALASGDDAFTETRQAVVIT
jgi:hypothetical protein